MKRQSIAVSMFHYKRMLSVAGALFLQPAASHAAGPAGMDTTSYLAIGGLSVLAIGMFFFFLRRQRAIVGTLKDISSELGTTRQRLDETSQDLEQAQKELKATTSRFQGILFEASVGMFQMDLDGQCTYVNNALQDLSGLYPKKALKEGFASAIHPDDRACFHEAWKAFTEGSEPFNQTFRFLFTKGRVLQEVHVACRANKIINAKKEVESYIGWVTDVTPFHEQQLLQQAETARYGHFVAETIEGYYRLAPAAPIPLSPSTSKMVDAILEEMVLEDCNDTFAAMYGAQPAELKGMSINELQGGCGPFRNKDSLLPFVEDGYRTTDLESVRQDPSGNRLNLINNIIGIIEDNKLVGIWGAQRNISHQKREKAELSSQVHFMHRILNALPADVHVKDTRCRYLYASKKLADRTGIPQEEWIGKTIFEVMPGTAKDHDQTAVETMKSAKLSRVERPYEARGKSGWMETVQIPLVSDAGLVEGVIGLSLDISDRKKKEEEVRQYGNNLENQLKLTHGELGKSQTEHAKAATALAQAIQKLKIAEAEKENREHQFKEHLAERKRTEDTLRRSEQGLIARQSELEKQLSTRLSELEAETDKRRKWEELLSIRQDELRKAEELSMALNEQYEREAEMHAKAAADLAITRTELEKIRRELEQIAANREQEIEALNANHKSVFESEHRARTTAEKHLSKTVDLLQRTQEEVQQLTAQHSVELEQEVSERKAAAEKLMQSMEELDDLRQQFNQRIETETKAIKQELAQKQIRERALRQSEKDLEERIKELEKMLRLKAQEYAAQIQAREGAEVQKQQVEQKLEQMGKRQQELIARETQKLHLHIAEIRLEEIKLRKQVGDLQREKESMEALLQTRKRDLEKAEQELCRSEAFLTDTQARLKQLSDNQDKVVAEETESLRKQLYELQQAGGKLREQLGELQQDKRAMEENLETRTADLAKAGREYRKVVEAYKESESKLKQLAEDQEALLAHKTRELDYELRKLRKTETDLRNQERQLQDRIGEQQHRIDALIENLKDETAKRTKTEKDLQHLQTTLETNQENAEVLVREQTRDLKAQVERLSISEAGLKQDLERAQQSIAQRDEALATAETERRQTQTRIGEIEQRLAGIREEHQAELKKSMAEVKQISRMNTQLVDELNDSLQDALSPVVKTVLIMEKAENLSQDQKNDLVKANHNCRSLIDMMNYRSELTHLGDGTENIRSGKCDLHGLMADIDRQFSHRADTKKLFFAVSFAQYQAAHNVPKLVETDEQKVRKILSILLGYAIDKTEKGRLGLHATRKSCEGDTASIAFELAYTGKENSDALLTAVFGSADEESVVDVKHGLTLARRYIGMLDGETSLEFRQGGITSLTVQFPFKKVASDAAISSTVDEKKAGAA